MIIHSMIVVEEAKNGRSYMFLVPQGSSYDEGKEVLSQMIEQIDSMKQEAIAQAEKKSAAAQPEEVVEPQPEEEVAIQPEEAKDSQPEAE
jgi:hypothetical protein